jgi:hypothetical protein
LCTLAVSTRYGKPGFLLLQGGRGSPLGLEAIEALYPLMMLIHVFLDNARYHHAKLVQKWLARPGCRIKLHFIPSYCPHLNPIERLWGLVTAAAVFMCSVPSSGFGLQPLRPWPDLLCGRLCTRGASVRATSGRPTLSGELSRAAEACSAICPSSRTTKDRDASGFTTSASG